MWAPTFVEETSKAFTSESDITLLATAIWLEADFPTNSDRYEIVVNRNRAASELGRQCPNGLSVAPCESVLHRLLEDKLMLRMSSVCVHLGRLERNVLLDEGLTFYEDALYCAHILDASSTMGFIDKPLCGYRFHDAQTVASDDISKRIESLRHQTAALYRALAFDDHRIFEIVIKRLAEMHRLTGWQMAEAGDFGRAAREMRECARWRSHWKDLLRSVVYRLRA